MELSSSDKERIQHQYDALAKKTLVGEAKSHRRTLAKRAAREVTFSDLSESELAQLFTTDEYESDYFRFQVSGFDVLVKNELLAEALNALPERKRDIILLLLGYERRGNWRTAECCTHDGFPAQEIRACEDQTVCAGDTGTRRTSSNRLCGAS